uniref:LRAT domain-containing protein n=1 Tax=Poecilia latipinna TaxID=48699 RepID=A0A3B3U399_9TELE
LLALYVVIKLNIILLLCILSNHFVFVFLLFFLIDEFQFGDIISYKTKCKAGITYKHFAVYVGDIDELLISHLLFPEVNNFLDDYTDPLTGVTFGKGDDKDIIKRITETYQSSTIYGFLHNNCEHIATYVRYGVRVAVQVRNRLHSFLEHLIFRSGNKEEGTMTQIKKMTFIFTYLLNLGLIYQQTSSLLCYIS